MLIKTVVFEKSVSINDEKIYLDERKEIIFVWRSNVWKSSTLNNIFNKKNLVKTSSKPWKTKTANLFLVNGKYYFTDLPGYWFAKLWQELKESLDSLISWYLEERKRNIKKVFILIDSKIWAQKTDIDMYKYLLELEIPVLVILSKIDKLSKNEILKARKETSEVFFWQKIIEVSNTKKMWFQDLEKEIKNSLTN